MLAAAARRRAPSDLAASDFELARIAQSCWAMSLVAQPGTPFSVPYFVHLVLWPLLLCWSVFLFRRRRSRGWPCSWRFGLAMAPACFFADAAALVAAIKWPSHNSTSFVLMLLWVAALFSVTSYFALRTPDDGGGGDDSDEDVPEPPWWPEFERGFRDYLRRGPQPPAKPPRIPTGVR
jgi:hypothetical protein